MAGKMKKKLRLTDLTLIIIIITIIFVNCTYSGALGREARSGAPWVRNRTPPERPSVRTTGIPMYNNSITRYGNPNATRGYFDGKSHSHPRLVEQKQLKSR